MLVQLWWRQSNIAANAGLHSKQRRRLSSRERFLYRFNKAARNASELQPVYPVLRALLANAPRDCIHYAGAIPHSTRICRQRDVLCKLEEVQGISAGLPLGVAPNSDNE